jgi:hypothetical protein
MAVKIILFTLKIVFILAWFTSGPLLLCYLAY